MAAASVGPAEEAHSSLHRDGRSAEARDDGRLTRSTAALLLGQYVDLKPGDAVVYNAAT